MIITGSALFVEPGTRDKVIKQIKKYPEITYHVSSESGTELIVNFETESQADLEILCSRLRHEIPEIIDIGHVYVNFEEEVEKLGREN